MASEENNQENKWKKWLKRLGVAGFLFFLIKGLLWLIVPAALVWFSVGQ
jgi:hypothetical protein